MARIPPTPAPSERRLVVGVAHWGTLISATLWTPISARSAVARPITPAMVLLTRLMPPSAEAQTMRPVAMLPWWRGEEGLLGTQFFFACNLPPTRQPLVGAR